MCLFDAASINRIERSVYRLPKWCGHIIGEKIIFFFVCGWGGVHGFAENMKVNHKSRYSWCFKNTPEFYDSLDCCQLYMYGPSSYLFVGLAYVFSNSF